MHKALSIRNAIIAKLESLVSNSVVKEVTTGALNRREYPSISVSLGPDDRLTKSSAFIDWDLNIYVDVYIASTDADVDTPTQQIRTEVHKALMADTTLGLGFVVEVEPLGQQEPQHSDASDLYTSVTRLPWSVRYRSNVADPSL